MRVHLLGVSYRTAGIDLRDRLAVVPRGLDHAVGVLRRRCPGAEAVVLSTCNRTELYLAGRAGDPLAGVDARGVLAEVCKVTPGDLGDAMLHRVDGQAVSHVFRVACGLDSMILGEREVLGQLRRAYEAAVERRSAGPVLHRVFQQAIRVAKRARTETGIDEGRVSIGSIAVDFARQIFERFDDKTVLGIGAGPAAKLTLRHMQALGPARVWVTNRSADRAGALASRLGLSAGGGGARPIGELDALITEADIVLTSTGAPRAILSVERVQPLLKKRRGRPLFIVDTAVPRDVDPRVGGLKNVYLYNIDDLQRVAAETHGQRQGQAARCETMLSDAVKTCMMHLENHDVGQVVHALRRRLHALGLAEQRRTGRKLTSLHDIGLADEIERLLGEHTHRLINKVLHVPLARLQARDGDAPVGLYLEALRELFELEDVASEGESVAAEEMIDDAAAPTVQPVVTLDPKQTTATSPKRVPAVAGVKVNK